MAETMSDESADPAARFVEQMGLICEYDNLPRIAGRMLGLLIVEDGPFSLRDLADRLKVSRASISTNARMLTDSGLVERVAKPGDRQDYYKLAGDPFRRMLEGKVRALRKMSAIFAGAAETFPADQEAVAVRLREMADFHNAAADTVAELINQTPQTETRAQGAIRSRSHPGDPRWL